MLSDMPSFCALTVVAPGVRFSALAIFLTPCFCFAIDFKVRTSLFVQARRTTFFFLAISAPLGGAAEYHTILSSATGFFRPPRSYGQRFSVKYFSPKTEQFGVLHRQTLRAFATTRFFVI